MVDHLHYPGFCRWMAVAASAAAIGGLLLTYNVLANLVGWAPWPCDERSGE